MTFSTELLEEEKQPGGVSRHQAGYAPNGNCILNPQRMSHCVLLDSLSLHSWSIGNHNLDLLLDSGASCSVIHKDYAPLKYVESQTWMKLVSADGRNLAQFGTLAMKLNAGDI